MALMLVSLVVNFVLMFRLSIMPTLSLVMLIMVGYYWGRDVVRESTYLGSHTNVVSNSIMCSMGLFILSEVMFFSGFFDALFYNLYGGDVTASMLTGVNCLDPLGLPLLNTSLLLSSGIVATWGHLNVVESGLVGFSIWVAILLGSVFMWVQYLEFSTSEFSMASSIYGSCFFGLTGFHGLHVIVSTGLLIMTALRLNGSQVLGKFVGLDCSFIYWHFVDVVWLVVMVLVYTVPLSL